MDDNSYASDLSLSFQSSSFESIEEVDPPTVSEDDIQPYQFEPELSDGNSDDGRNNASLDGDDDMEQRLGNTNWCDCGNCESMPKAEECICCQELRRVTEKMEELTTPVSCITNHPGFEPVCLNQYVLETAYFQYRQQYGEIQVTTEERNRYTAYRQLARWCWGYLGKSVRVHLPACATLAIRKKFPSNQYKGFEEA
ncbi:P2X purinoceptor 7-like [Mytilus trossulus]|uniref:P2X purinoceptor 7-like n=1 Tax=Mytilus trossulus TaxID=6551 RepID=UPI0030063763